MGEVMSKDATSAVFPAKDGLVGMLPNHSPLMASLGKGEMFLRTVENQGLSVEVTGGFAEFRDNVLTLLADKAGTPVDRGTAGPFEPGRKTGQA